MLWADCRERWAVWFSMRAGYIIGSSQSSSEEIATDCRGNVSMSLLPQSRGNVTESGVLCFTVQGSSPGPSLLSGTNLTCVRGKATGPKPSALNVSKRFQNCLLTWIDIHKSSLAGSRTDKSALISIKKQETALTLRCGAAYRADTHHGSYSYNNNNKHHKHMRY